ncbi:MAG: hypothetical protein WA775_06010 [Psychroserpens sp.]|uniref:hypothetical protein n=1 Tax=Psychroserpens sp. TaxID=2020870 RepID=UPI003C9AB136
MKILKISFWALVAALMLLSCMGDQKTVVGQEYGDTDFVNEDFTANKMNFEDLPKDLCEFLNEQDILKGYDNATSVTFDGKNSFMNKNCQFAVIYFNDKSQFIKGSIFITETTVESENWIETWEFKKKRFNSAEYVDNLGMAAIWNGKQRKLEIKMKGYIVAITVPPKMIAKSEVDNESSVKDAAVAIAESTNLF